LWYFQGMIAKPQFPSKGKRTLTAEVSPNTEERLCVLAAQSGQTVEAFLGALAEAAVQMAPNTNSQPLRPLQPQSPEARVAALQAWVHTHSEVAATAEDSRESIYAGREE
jgi:hypothetical protein